MCLKSNNKKAILLFELILVIILISIITYILYPKENNQLKLQVAIDRLELYLNKTRLNALSDNKYEEDNPLWHKRRWTLKFFNCRKDVGGIYYVIYSDNNLSGIPSLEESLIDPLTKKRVYSSNTCVENENSSEFVLLTKKFGIEKIEISCNDTTTIGQISFDYDGNVFTKLSNYDNEFYQYRLEERCEIRFFDKFDNKKTINIEPKTAFLEQN